MALFIGHRLPGLVVRAVANPPSDKARSCSAVRKADLATMFVVGASNHTLEDRGMASIKYCTIQSCNQTAETPTRVFVTFGQSGFQNGRDGDLINKFKSAAVLLHTTHFGWLTGMLVNVLKKRRDCEHALDTDATLA